MNAYVIKTWHASDETDANGNYIHITGRAGGLISWLFNLLGISPTVELKVSAEQISFVEGSWGGLVQYNTPLENVCATLYGYTKPWKEALIIGLVFGMATFFLMGIPGILIGIIYYFLNKTLTVGFTDMGGRASYINFKRSIIEGHNVDEQAAAETCRIIQTRVQKVTASQLVPQPRTPTPTPTSNKPPAPPPPPPPPPVEELRMKYYYADEQSQPKGPFSFVELLAFDKSGAIKPDTNVIAENSSDWIPWSVVKSKEGKM